jgi:Flp pilus assembly protein TadB
VFAALDAHNRERLPRWAQVALSAGFTFVLFAFGASVAFVGGAWSGISAGPTAFVIIVFLVVVPFLVAYAYPRRVRRWYHWVLFEACVLGGFTLPVPLVYLPWLIVTRRAWREAA